MPEIIRLGPARVEADDWESAAFLSLGEWREQRAGLLADGGRIGIRLDPADDPAVLAPDVERIQLVAVDFPRFADGRGYSCAALLRTRHGYRGELRAVGDVGRDQLFYLKRCGFDAFALAPHRDPHAALASLADFSLRYQGSVDDPLPLFRRRRAPLDPSLDPPLSSGMTHEHSTRPGDPPASATTIFERAAGRAEEGRLAYAGAVTCGEAHQLASAAAATIVDVRTRSEYEQVGHVEGTELIEWRRDGEHQPDPSFLTRLAQRHRPDEPLLLICRSGVRSHYAAELAAAAGFTRVYNVLDGFEKGWLPAGLPAAR